ncbi:hypothetical protein [uncultured Ruegeria sp.]|uniref:WD40/YVTN/BNR-like repeat-containing protein n=1 Tax=uncultured Ruegeria sp. TaxID=259304 RepID=UPI00260968D5|nr:hypothetical protein [uncultured Ruegeria sp.]
MRPILDEFTLTCGAAKDDITLAFSCVIDKLAGNKDEPHAALLEMHDGTVKAIGKRNHSVVSVCYSKGAQSGPAFLGDWGKFIYFLDGEPIEEEITLERGPLRKLAWIDGAFYASGASMQVFRRDGVNQWTDISPSEKLRKEFAHQNLESIAGNNTQELYAAGEFGVVWRYDGTEWHPVQCQTNACFYTILCANDGRVYAAGQNGTVLRGKQDDFELLCSEPGIIDIWGMAEYYGKIYLAGYTALFLLDVEDELTLIPEPLKIADSFSELSVGGDTMWSLGMKDVLIFDEEYWLKFDQVTMA